MSRKRQMKHASHLRVCHACGATISAAELPPYRSHKPNCAQVREWMSLRSLARSSLDEFSLRTRGRGGKRRHARPQSGVGKQVAALNALLRK